MTLDDQIAALNAEAAPLRCLEDDDPDKRPLAGIVDRINALRAKQPNVGGPGDIEYNSWIASLNTKRGPGRPRKAA